MNNNVTLKDIALAAGVRPAVVSVVLNDKQYTRVSPARREEIRRIAESMGYRPNIEASSLRRGKKATVGVFLPSWEDTLLLELIRGLSDAANKLSVPLTFSFGMTAESYFRFIDSMESYRHTGMISYVPFWDRHYERILSRLQEYIDDGGKVISLNTAGWPMKQTISLDIDEKHGGELAAKHLLRFRGVRSHALVSIESQIYYLRDAAFCSALEEEGRKARKYQLEFDRSAPPEKIHEFVEKMLSEAELPVGIFSTTPDLCPWILLGAAIRGWTYGKDYEIVCYDRSFGFGDSQPVVRIIQPFYQIGYMAVEKLSDMLMNKTVSSEILKPKLVKGGNV